MTPRQLLFLAAGLSACSAQPRAASYFAAHPAEAERVVARCKTGATRGAECVNALAATTAAANEARKNAYRKAF